MSLGTRNDITSAFRTGSAPPRQGSSFHSAIEMVVRRIVFCLRLKL
jgi:hypothetical protein